MVFLTPPFIRATETVTGKRRFSACRGTFLPHCEGRRQRRFGAASVVPARFGDNSRDFHDATYGIGVEVGPRDIGLKGLTGPAGVRLRAEMSTFGAAHSLRPMAGILARF